MECVHIATYMYVHVTCYSPPPSDASSPAPHTIVGLPDMVHMSTLSASLMLDNIALRYDAHAIYTYVSTIVIAVNPYAELGLYRRDVMQMYSGGVVSEARRCEPMRWDARKK